MPSVAAPRGFWSIQLPPPSTFGKYLTHEQECRLKAYLYADDLNRKPYTRWSFSEDPFDEKEAVAAETLLQDMGPPTLKEEYDPFASFRPHMNADDCLAFSISFSHYTLRYPVECQEES